MNDHTPLVLSRMPLKAREEYLKLRDRAKRPQIGDVSGRMGSYISEHPTRFNWTSPVRRLVEKYQAMFPWQTYACTYVWHPPYDPPAITKRYDRLSVDFWGGGVVNGKYQGYRGKPLPDALHKKLFNVIFDDPDGPKIDWILSNGWMWSWRTGWSPYDPYDPYNADMAHRKHIHITFRGG